MLSTVLRIGEGRTLRQLAAVVARINALSAAVEPLADSDLRSKTAEFRTRIAAGESLDALMPEAFAVVREAAWRVLSQRPYDEQVMAGAALHLGTVAEMMTGEGKTLAAALPTYLNALDGNGVHLITVNDYLARRDSEWMGRVHRFLGLRVGVVLAPMEPHERRTAYDADVTYGTNTEFGFDYLRDNMARSPAAIVQRGLHFAIVDEVDSILIDEARTPLVISGPAQDASDWFAEFARLADSMRPGTHYEVDRRKRTVAIHEQGVAYVEDQLGLDNLYEVTHAPLVGYLHNAVRAKELLHGERDYIVTEEGEVLIVDNFTGRILIGRRYNEGLHQAIEAKEGVQVRAENQTLATITLQNYFRRYTKLAGMTGTARTEAAEFWRTYRLGVTAIPAHRPMTRTDQPDLVFKTELAKFDAVVDEIAARHATGQPVLIGTTSVEKSDYLSRRLNERGIPHGVLNARHLEQEAAVVAVAGRRGAVTVATDMAGRGTDIVLGGHVDFLTDRLLRERGLDPAGSDEDYAQAWRRERPRIEAAAAAEARAVVALGGLCVIGTERHESRRIDDQLRGRAGRQGDPGETRFYLSLDDDLMRRFSTVNLEKLMARLKMPDDEPIAAAVVSRAICSAQTRVEQRNDELRREVLDYDEVMDEQRKVVYAARRRVLAGEDLHRELAIMLADLVTGYVEGATAGRSPGDWDLGALTEALSTLYPVGVRHRDLPTNRQALLRTLLADAERALAAREAGIDAHRGEGAARRLEREIVLDAIDGTWRTHLYEMDWLKAGIGLRALAQRDPIVEYRRDAYEMFVRMVEALKERCVAAIFAAPG